MAEAAQRVLSAARAYARRENASWPEPGGRPRPVRLTPVTLVEAVLGLGCINLVRSDLLPGHGAVCRVDGKWAISISESAPQAIQQFVMLHELAHTQLGREVTEDDCDALAAELLVACWGSQSQRWRDAVKTYGPRFERRGLEAAQ